MVTILAFNTGKAVVENAAVKISVDNLPHIRPEKAILLGKALIVDLFYSLGFPVTESGLVTQPATAQNPGGMCNCCGY